MKHLPSPLGDQLVHKAALATSAADLRLHSSQKLTRWLEHYALAMEPGRELVPWLDAQGTAHCGGQDEPSLGSESKPSWHALMIMAPRPRCDRKSTSGPGDATVQQTDG